MDLYLIIFLSSLVILLTGVLLITFNPKKMYWKFVTNRMGKAGEKTVARKLDHIAKKNCNQWRVLHNIYLPLYNKTTQIDHLIIGRFGVLIVESKTMGGVIYGKPDQKHWTRKTGQNNLIFYNPLLQNKTHVDCLSYILRKAGLSKFPVYSLIVFAHRHTVLYIPKGMPVITLSLLKQYLKKFRYRKNNHVDVEQIYQLILKHQVLDAKRIKAHNDNVKQMIRVNKIGKN